MSVNKGLLGFGDISVSRSRAAVAGVYESCMGRADIPPTPNCVYVMEFLCSVHGVKASPAPPHLTPPFPSQAWLDLLM